MEEILRTLFADTNLWSSIISTIALGLMAVISNFIVRGVQSINKEKKYLDSLKPMYARQDAIAKMVMGQSELYKNAIVSSNLSVDAKLKAVEDYSVVTSAFNEYKAATVEITETAVETAKRVEIAPEVKQELVDAGKNVLSQLRDQLK